jgi:hypothetical protein
MPTPSSGQISFANIAVITKGSSTAQVDLNESLSRSLAAVPSGQISINNFYNKPSPGSNTYTTPGTYTFLCPPYQTLSIDVRGGGGGGGGGSTAYIIWYRGTRGSVGANSSFNSSTIVLGNGGAGGDVQPEQSGANPNGGGTASGGDTNTKGGGSAGGNGGSGNGAAPSQNGGFGGRAVKSWVFNSTAGFLSWGTNYTVVVGRGGAGGGASSAGGGPGGTGANGSVIINWS